jgi:hypothetical protein
MKKAIALLMIVCCIFVFIGCNNNAEVSGLWANAKYTEDTVLGEGAKTVNVSVSAEDKTIIFTIKTDEQYLGDALIYHELIAGEESEYGLYVKTVNGIIADYDVDGSYWAFYQNGEYMMTGVDTTEFADGESYELVYTK